MRRLDADCSIQYRFVAESFIVYRYCERFVADHTGRIWCVETGSCILQYVGHSGSVNSIRFHPTQDVVVTSSGDQKVHLWKAQFSALNQELLVSAGGCRYMPLYVCTEGQCYTLISVLVFSYLWRYCAPSSVAEYCPECVFPSVCLSVCLFACISRTIIRNAHNFLCMLPPAVVLFPVALQYVM